MSRLRLLGGCVTILALVTFAPAFAAKVKEKAPQQDENARPAELVKIGLQAELAGNGPSRQLHLQAALDLEPEYAPAHWQLGDVRVGDEWLSVAKASAAISKTPQYSWYRSKRMELDGSVKSELALARWCEKEGMHDRAQFHYARLLQSPEVKESNVKEVIKKLDLIDVNGQYRSRKEVEEIQRDTAADAAAWNTWANKFAEWRQTVESRGDRKYKLFLKQVQSVNDFHVTPLIEFHLLNAGEAWSLELVAMLSKFPQPPATTALARCSVLSPWASARTAAILELKQRKLHDFVPQLLAGLTPQTKSQFFIRIGNDRSIDIRHQAVTEDAQRRLVTVASEHHQAMMLEFPVGPMRGHAANPNSPSLTEAAQKTQPINQAAQLQTAAALQRLWETEQLVGIQNRLAKVSDATFYETLEKTTGQNLPRQPGEWGSWWTTYNEVSYEKPTYYYVQQYSAPLYRANVRIPSCFIAGTPVFTESGPQPIESIQPGDRVLSQDPNTGDIAFKLVEDVTVRPPSKLRKISLEGSEIVTTLGHPFWVNGTGWKMAKELQPQQNLHTLGGAARIVKVEELPHSDQAYNLVVADYNTYFVGSAHVLVHDNLYRQPTLAKVPGLVEARK